MLYVFIENTILFNKTKFDQFFYIFAKHLCCLRFSPMLRGKGMQTSFIYQFYQAFCPCPSKYRTYVPPRLTCGSQDDIFSFLFRKNIQNYNVIFVLLSRSYYFFILHVIKICFHGVSTYFYSLCHKELLSWSFFTLLFSMS